MEKNAKWQFNLQLPGRRADLTDDDSLQGLREDPHPQYDAVGTIFGVLTSLLEAIEGKLLHGDIFLQFTCEACSPTKAPIYERLPMNWYPI
jgi:hypothetical protein